MDLLRRFQRQLNDSDESSGSYDEEFVPDSESDPDSLEYDSGDEGEDGALEMESLAAEQREYDARQQQNSENGGREGEGQQQPQQQGGEGGATLNDRFTALQSLFSSFAPHAEFAAPAAPVASAAAVAVASPFEQSFQQLLCAICENNQRTMLFMPCRHCSACQQCAANLTECPICRQQVETKIKLFFS